MHNSKRCLLGLLVALIAWCQAESFLVNTRVTSTSARHKVSNRIRHVDLQRNAFARIRGGEVSISAKSLYETIPKSGFAKSLATVLHSFIDPAITGGFLSGGLHAITGPDHLAALIAPTVGKSGLHGLKVGAIWGVGHGVTAIGLGLCAFFLKGQFTGRFAVMEKLSTLAESVVGLSILFIGIMGIKESREVEADAFSDPHLHNHHNCHHHSHHHAHESQLNPTGTLADGVPITANAVSNTSCKKTTGKTYRAIFANGLLHGFSWDGAPSLAPAITMSSWQRALSFLAAYSLGTIVAMSLAAGSVGELSTRVGKASDNPDLPRKLSFVSSMAAVAIGVYLTGKSIFLR